MGKNGSLGEGAPSSSVSCTTQCFHSIQNQWRQNACDNHHKHTQSIIASCCIFFLCSKKLMVYDRVCVWQCVITLYIHLYVCLCCILSMGYHSFYEATRFGDFWAKRMVLYVQTPEKAWKCGEWINIYSFSVCIYITWRLYR